MGLPPILGLKGNIFTIIPASLRNINQPVNPCCWGATPVSNTVVAQAVVAKNVEVMGPRLLLLRYSAVLFVKYSFPNPSISRMIIFLAFFSSSALSMFRFSY